MKYLKKFNNLSDYEMFTDGDDYILPNVSYIEGSNEVLFNPLLILKPDTWYATYKDNKERYENPFNFTFKLTELKIDGEDRSDLLIPQYSGFETEITITCLASEINLAMDSDSGNLMGTAPSEYFVNNPSSFKLKPLDSNFYDENAYICCLFNVPELGGVGGLSLPIMDALEMGYCTYNEVENSVTATVTFLQMLQIEMPFPFCAVLATVNEETGEPTFYDTINESISTPLRTITCLSNNVNILLDNYDSYYIDNIEKEYWVYNPSVLTVKLTNNESFEDKNICFSLGVNILGRDVLYFNINDMISSFGGIYDTSTNTLDLSQLLSIYHYNGLPINICVFICDINEDTDEVIIHDTIIETNGGFSPLHTYVFEDTDEHTVEFKTYDGGIIPLFSYSKILTELIMPDNVTEDQIYEGMFSRCTSLRKIKLSKNITTLKSVGGEPEGFFTDCASLESITLPKNISAIGDWCFNGCSSLNSIRCESIIAPSLVINSSIFGYIPSTGALYYPAGSDYSTWKAELPGWTYVEF